MQPMHLGLRALVLTAAMLSIPATLPATAPPPPPGARPLALDGVALNAFLPLPASTVARLPQLDPASGLAVTRIEPGLRVVTDGIYASAFLITRDGVVVFDAPPSFAAKLPAVLRQEAPGQRVVMLVYSHGHTDHMGGAGVFADVAGLEVVAHRAVAEGLAARRDHVAVPQPTRTFDADTVLTVGGETIDLRLRGSWHSSDADVLIYLPHQKLVLAIDSFAPGYVPFKGFAITSDLGAFFRVHGEILALPIEHVLTGHEGILGDRQDVETSRAYLADVQGAVLAALKRQAPEQRLGQAFAAIGSTTNPYLAFRSMIESVADEAAAEVIGRWKDRLGGVDVWAKDHCQTMLLYLYTH